MSSSGGHTLWSALIARVAGPRRRPPSPMTADLQPAQPETVEPPPFRRLIAYFLELGSLGFGGPIATVGYMQRDLVEQRRWMSRQDLLDGIALGQTMPGPLAAQVAMWVGFLRRGAIGALATALAFIAPSFLLVIAIGFLYVRYQGLPVVQSLFYGISPAVIAIIALAAWKLARLKAGPADRRSRSPTMGGVRSSRDRDGGHWNRGGPVVHRSRLANPLLGRASDMASLAQSRFTARTPNPGNAYSRRSSERGHSFGPLPLLPQSGCLHLRQRPCNRAFSSSRRRA